MPQQCKQYVLCKQEISKLFNVFMCQMSKNKLKIVYYAVSSVQFSNPAKLSGSCGIFARAGFLSDLEKVMDSSRSRNRNPVQP